MPIAYYLEQRFVDHDNGYGHPERPQRLAAVQRALDVDGFAASELVQLPAPAAPDEALERVHSASYLRSLRRVCEDGGAMLDPDTTVNEASFEAAVLAAGAGLDAVERIRAGEFSRAFVAARPPGHHARPRVAMGFCIVNTVAVVAAALAADGAKVAIIDWDAHHGNGTQEAFWERGDVFYASTHQYPFYPFTGRADEVGVGAGHGTTLNIPLAAGSSEEDMFRAFGEQVLPAVTAFGPDWVLVSAGFDAHRDDPMCHLGLSAESFSRLARDVAGLGAPVIGFLEGGYDLVALGTSTRATLEVWATDNGGLRAGGFGGSIAPGGCEDPPIERGSPHAVTAARQARRERSGRRAADP